MPIVNTGEILNPYPGGRLLLRYLDKTQETIRFYSIRREKISPEISNALLYCIALNTHILFCPFRKKMVKLQRIIKIQIIRTYFIFLDSKKPPLITLSYFIQTNWPI